MARMYGYQIELTEIQPRRWRCDAQIREGIVFSTAVYTTGEHAVDAMKKTLQAIN